MSLKIVNAGSNNDAFKHILFLIKNQNSLENSFLIVPDRASLLTEQKLIDELGGVGSLNVDVITLNTFCQIILGGKESSISSFGLSAIIKKIILENYQNLNTFKKVCFKPGFIDSVYKTILQFKSCQISPEKILENLNVLPKSLQEKLGDIALIYQKYEKFLNENIYDDPSKFQKVIDAIEYNGKVKNSKFYFAKFESFTSQAMEIIAILSKASQGVVVGCAGTSDAPNKKIYSCNAGATLLKYLTEKNVLFVVENIKLQDEFLSNIYSFNQKQIAFNGKLNLLEFGDEEREIEFVANKIFTAHKNGANLNDFCVACANLQKYSNTIKTVFSRLGILFNIDEPYRAIDHAYIKFILSICDVFESNFEESCVFRLLDCNIPNHEFLDVCTFKNYVREHGINGSMFFEEFFDETAENVRKKFVGFLFENYKKYKNAKTFEEYILVLQDVLQAINFKELHDENVKNFQNALNELDANKAQAVYERILVILEDLKTILGKNTTSQKDFASVLYSAFESVEIFVSPTYINAVNVCDAFDSFFVDVKNLFIIGACDGDFARTVANQGIVRDEEIDILGGSYVISPKISEINAKNLFRTFELCNISKNLTISYAKKSCGAICKPSLLMLSLSKLCGQKIEFCEEGFEVLSKNQAKTLLYRKLNLAQKGVASKHRKELTALANVFGVQNKIHTIKAKPQNLNNAENLLANNQASASQLNKFATCPFKHFMEYGLRARKNKTAEIESVDIGNLYHKFCEEYVKLKKFRKSIDAKKLMQKIGNSEEFCQTFNNPANALIASLIVNEAPKIANNLNFQIENSNFVPTSFEEKFGFECDNGGAKILGKIDRLDCCENDAIVIDYKTGSKSFDLSDIYFGTDLQLALYANACKSKDKNFVGAFYFPISNKLNKKSFSKLDGFFLKDRLIARKLDKNLSEGTGSQIINSLSLKKDGDFSQYTKAFSQKELDAILSYTQNQAQMLGNQIKSGFIEPTVASNGKLPCENCVFKNTFYCQRANVRDVGRKVVAQDFCNLKIDKTQTKEAENGKL